jgi:hypothetical protein
MSARSFRPAEPWNTVDAPHLPLIRESDGTIRHGKVVVAGHDWQREMGNEDLNLIRIDHQTTLRFGDVEMVIESPFVLTVDDTDHPLDPDDRGGMGP